MSNNFSFNSQLTYNFFKVKPQILFLVKKAIFTSQNYLRSFAEDSEFLTNMASVFGESKDDHYYQSYRDAWQTNNFAILSNIEILTNKELSRANAAYSQQTDKIYLSLEFLNHNFHNIELIASTLLQEAGHRLDAEVNKVDKLGDEGHHFSIVVRGGTVSKEELAQIVTKNIVKYNIN